MKKISRTFAVAALAAFVSGHSLAQDQLSVDEFVRQTFIAGMPYAEATQYGKRDLVTLKKMLKDPQEADYYGNIVATLALNGDESVVPDIIGFIERDFGSNYDDGLLHAKLDAIMALGYVINHHNSHKAFTYLEQGLEPEAWNSRGSIGLSAHHETAEERNIDLSKHAALGLTLSGAEKAVPKIKALKAKQVTTYSKSDQPTSLSPAPVEELIAENERIRKMGLKAYYSKQHSH